MPFAHYRPLEQSLKELHDDTANDDDNEEEEEDDNDNYNCNCNCNYNENVYNNKNQASEASQQSSHNQPHHQYYTHCHQHLHPQHQHTHTQLTDYYAPIGTPPTINMSGLLGRQAAGTRRYIFILLICLVCITVVYCMLTDVRMNLSNGVDDTFSDFEQHAGTDSSTGHILNETLQICSESHEDHRLFMQDNPSSAYAQLPVIYFVTPTYPRREQIPELIRLAHTLLHVARLHWLVANDHETCNTYLDTLLNRFGIPYTHLASPMPSKFRTHKPAPRGVANRRAALQWLKQHNITSGVLYFGDDDNTYDLQLFSEIRETKRVSMFPVGLIADYAISGPVVRKGRVIAFLDSWVADRRWPVDMAGFAVNLGYMSQYPNVNMPYKPGYEEDLFLRSICLRMDQIEPRGNNCTEILVWHTQTKNKKSPVVRFSSKFMDERSNLGSLFRALRIMGVARASDTEGIKAQISKNGKAKPHSYFLS